MRPTSGDSTAASGAARPALQTLFAPDERGRHDFSSAPRLVRRLDPYPRVPGAFRTLERAAWARYQARFMRWANTKKRFRKGQALASRDLRSAYFGRHGSLAGHVLDIGGATGVFRQWWTGGEAEWYLVHEPAWERPERPSPEMQDLYDRAFDLPLTAVEGVGEYLPYREGVLDTCLIAAVLDHVQSPRRVLSEARRCLRPEGRLVLFQQCLRPSQGAVGRNDLVFPGCAGVNRRDALRVARIFGDLLFHRGHHIWTFAAEEIERALQAAGFRRVESSVVDRDRNLIVFEGIR